MVPSQQFQALFNSLFKVLFIFPSQYLFAIGLPPVFSLRWNLPPALSCNPKQLDSVGRPSRGELGAKTGLSPSPVPCSKGINPGPPPGTPGTTPRRDWQHGLFPLQSPLLRESWLVSFPPLNYMLKFSGSSCVYQVQGMASCKYRRTSVSLASRGNKPLQTALEVLPNWATGA